MIKKILLVLLIILLSANVVEAQYQWWNTSSLYAYTTNPTRYGTASINISNSCGTSNSTYLFLCGGGVFYFTNASNTTTVTTNLYFVDNNESSLPMYFKNISSANVLTEVYVNFSNLDSKQIYVNQSNRTIDNTAACSQVFRYCDDFENGVVTWTRTSGTISETGGYLRYTDSTGFFHSALSGYTPTATGSWGVLAEVSVEGATDAYAYVGQPGTDGAGGATTPMVLFGNFQGTANMVLYNYNAASTTTNFVTSAAYWDEPTHINVELRKQTGRAEASIFNLSNLHVETQVSTTNIPSSANTLGLYLANNLPMRLYFFAVMDYNSSESAFSTFEYFNWKNNYTSNQTGNFSIPKQTTVHFNATRGSFTNWWWWVDGSHIGTGSTFDYTFTTNKTYFVEVSTPLGASLLTSFNVSSENFGNFTPTLISPTNASTVTFTFPPQFADIDFSWTNVSTSGFNILVAEDENFNLVEQNTTVATNYTTLSLEAGTHYWKVRTYNVGETSGNWSSTFHFTLSPSSSGVANNSSNGVVYQIIDGNSYAISGAKVEIYNATWYDFMITGDTGYYLFQDLVPGETYTLKASKVDEFDDSSLIPMTVVGNATVTINILMQKCTSAFNCFYNKQFVTFAVQDIYFNRYTDVSITSYKNGDLTVDDIQTTDYSGKATFLMIKDQQYRLVIENSSQGISQTTYVIPGEIYYVLIIDVVQDSFTTDANENDLIMVTPTSTIINATAAYINVTYVNSSGTAHIVSAYLNTTNRDGTTTVVSSQTSSTANHTFSFLVTNYAGKAYSVSIIVYGSPQQHLWKYGFKYSGLESNPYSANDTFLGIISVLIILFIASFFSEQTVGIGGIVVSGITGVLYAAGMMNASWFGAIPYCRLAYYANYGGCSYSTGAVNPYVYYAVIPFAVTICMTISILYVINQRNAKEGFS